jgi:hypothetical protein
LKKWKVLFSFKRFAKFFFPLLKAHLSILAFASSIHNKQCFFAKKSMYDSSDGVSEHAASPSPPFSLTHVHRCIGSRNTVRQILPTSAKLTYLSMYDNSDGVSEHAASTPPPSSLTHVHRCIGSPNTVRQILPTSAKLMYLCMYDSRNGVTQCMRGV